MQEDDCNAKQSRFFKAKQMMAFLTLGEGSWCYFSDHEKYHRAILGRIEDTVAACHENVRSFDAVGLVAFLVQVTDGFGSRS